MERALYVTRLKDIPEPALGYERLYYGAEFCEWRIPTKQQLAEAIEIAADHNWYFSLMTPYVTDRGLAQLEPLFELLDEGDEIIVNDWGVLDLIAEEYGQFTPVLGRLLTKQKRGPRILNVIDETPESMLEHFRRSNVDVPHLSRWLTETMRVGRYEIDNLLQGFERKPNIPASLYTPWLYISTTRMCLVNHCENRDMSLRAIFKTDCACQTHEFTLTHENMPAKLYLFGNTIFTRNDELPANLERMGIDRLVFQPRPPI